MKQALTVPFLDYTVFPLESFYSGIPQGIIQAKNVAMHHFELETPHLQAHDDKIISHSS